MTSFESVHEKLSCPLSTILIPPHPAVKYSFCFDLKQLNLSVKKIWKEAYVSDIYLDHLLLPEADFY